MHKIPFKAIGTCSAILTLLIIVRCFVSAGRVLYYGGTEWLSVIQADPWLYVSVGSAALSVLCFTMSILQERLEAPAQEEYEEDPDEDEDFEDLDE